MRVSEQITVEEVNKWKDGDIITIAAGTGSGKSHFIKNRLYDIAKNENKKILMLIHRVNCVNQFQHEIIRDNKTDVIDIKTYQSIDSLYKRGGEFNFDQYDIICADEFHYFLFDSAYNHYTDLSLEAILNQTDKIRIFMSATGGYMRQFINNFKNYDTIDYSVPLDFSFIRKLKYFSQNDTLDEHMENFIANGKKAIFFIESAEKAYELYEKFEDYALFNCSRSNDKYYKHVKQDKIESMLINERFDEQILITTTVMDAGVNIHDDELSNIVVDVRDIGTLIQCIGRKRLKNKNDKITLHVKNVNNMRLGGMLTHSKKNVTMARYFTEHGEQAFVRKYYRQFDKSNIVYVENKFGGITKRRNDLMYFKNELDIMQIEAMLKIGKDGYIEYLGKLFNIKPEKLHEKEAGDKLRDYLSSIVGKRLDKQKQNELIEMIDLKVNGRQQRSYRKLNEGLEMINMPFIIIPKKSGDIRYWILEEINN